MQVVDVQAVVVVEVAYNRNAGPTEKESFFVIYPHRDPTTGQITVLYLSRYFRREQKERFVVSRNAFAHSHGCKNLMKTPAISIWFRE
jgi:hypothetical protein